MKPLQTVKWPNVTLPSLPRFETSLDKWFHRKGIPIWITEYGHETKPGEPHGVTLSQQRSYTATAINFAKNDPRVQMFIWFIFRDNPTSSWQSGFYTEADGAKPALTTWSSLAALVDGTTVKVKAGSANPVVRVALPRIAYYSQPGQTIGMTYQVFLGTRLVAVKQPAVPLAFDGTVSFPAEFTPAAGKTYTLTIDANAASGAVETTHVALVAAK
jgi:hypothetical protein